MSELESAPPIDKREQTKRRDEQLAALIAGAAVAVFFVWYWWGQIQSVIDLLRLAYG